MTSEGVTAARTRVGRVLRPGVDSSRGELIAGALMALPMVFSIRDCRYLLRRDRGVTP
jgi:hypothetical protein